jgi:starvation-inducible DNA-binding protein
MGGSTMKPNLGIPDQSREAVGELLNALLADLHVLYVKTRNYHWNVTGPHFHDLHKLFESQYEALAGEIDEVAERARALGVPAQASVADFARRARLPEHPGKFPEAPAMLANLLADHEALVRTLRADQDACAAKHGDAGTADFLTGLMEEHEKTAWMLRATLT